MVHEQKAQSGVSGSNSNIHFPGHSLLEGEVPGTVNLIGLEQLLESVVPGPLI